MSSLLTNPMAKRLLRPAATLVDRRIKRSASELSSEIKAEIKALRNEVSQLRGQQYASGLLFDKTGRSGPRTPSPAQIDALVKQIAAVTGESETFARRNVVIAFRNVIALEALAVGRLAGSTSNICGKLATIPLLSPPNQDVLEIGTLHGLFAATLMRMLHRAGHESRLTIVDPLEGTQLQPGAKPVTEVTGTPIRMDVVRANLELGGRAGVEARIEQGFSGDPAVRAVVSDRKYGVIVVDGDHSADGVFEDLGWVEDIVAPGGIVVLDDYGDARWPGVKEALDKHMAGGTSRLKMLGSASTSAFLRAN